jgi:hypothetical protein
MRFTIRVLLWLMVGGMGCVLLVLRKLGAVRSLTHRLSFNLGAVYLLVKTAVAFCQTTNHFIG